jgi:hypothetical protein
MPTIYTGRGANDPATLLRSGPSLAIVKHGLKDGPAPARALVAVLLAAVMAMTTLTMAGSAERPDFPRPPNWFDARVYHHYPDLTTELQDLAAAHGDTMVLDSIGSSVRGRSLWCARIEDPDVAGPKLDLYVDGGHHGNEYLGTELAVLLIHHLLEDTGDSLVEEVLATSVVWVTPMINPDGNTRDQRNNANGIDLNRNYPFSFTPGGSHGDSPASEPEVRANVDFMERTGVDMYLTGHTGTRALIYPWGDREEACPDAAMYERFRDVAEATGLSYGPSATTLYVAEGSSEDFAYGALGAVSWTFEVDGQQTNQISRREDIAVRLADELDVTMQLLSAAPLVQANVTATTVDAPGEVGAGATADVTVELENPTYTPANNTTVTVEVLRDGEVVGMANTVVDVPGEGTATARVRLGFPDAGTYDLRVTTEYRCLLWENGTNGTSVVDAGPVVVQGGLFGGGGTGIVALLVVLAVVPVVLYVARRRGLLRRRPLPAGRDQAST